MGYLIRSPFDVAALQAGCILPQSNDPDLLEWLLGLNVNVIIIAMIAIIVLSIIALVTYFNSFNKEVFMSPPTTYIKTIIQDERGFAIIDIDGKKVASAIVFFDDHALLPFNDYKTE